MTRREFITLLGGAAGWPLAAQAQQPAVPVVGLLSGIDSDDRQLAALRQGLNEVGYIAGKSVTIDHRSAAGQYDRLPALANDLVGAFVSLQLSQTGEAVPTAFVLIVGTGPAGLFAACNLFGMASSRASSSADWRRITRPAGLLCSQRRWTSSTGLA
jgi:putative tryptophan/tyrosine transport system substrate-binding protein